MYIPETRYLTGTTNSSDNLDGEGSSTSTGYDAGTSSVDRATNVLGPLPDLYQINTTAVSVGFLLLAAILVLLMQLGYVYHLYIYSYVLYLVYLYYRLPIIFMIPETIR